MAATITIQGCTGENAATEATITGLMMRANDAVTVTKANPITIPAEGTAYSFEKWIRFKCTAAPDNQVANFKYWGPNTPPGTGLVLYAGTTDTGATPVATDSSVATTQQDTNYYDTSHTLAIGGTLTTEDDESDYLVLQLDVGSTASPGDIAQQTHNFSYDEN
jgi:hypothetical protein